MTLDHVSVSADGTTQDHAENHAEYLEDRKRCEGLPDFLLEGGGRRGDGETGANEATTNDSGGVLVGQLRLHTSTAQAGSCERSE